MKSPYIQHSKLDVEPVLKVIRESTKHQSKATFNGVTVNIRSLRLFNFARSITCVSCGVVATHFAIERHKVNNHAKENWHLNLYADAVLMTHDHTLARSLGGKNDPANTRTMCSPCNGKKAVNEQRLGQLLKASEKTLDISDIT